MAGLALRTREASWKGTSMPTHRGVVIRADHSGFGSAAGRKRLPPVVYRAVFADKVFRGSLESVMQQIDDALGSTPTARIPIRMPPPPAPKRAPANKAAKRTSAKAPRARRKGPRPAKKKARRS
jgi:hypothetical protein